MLAPPKNDIQDEIAFLIKKWFLYTKEVNIHDFKGTYQT